MLMTLLISLLVYLPKQTYADHLHNHDMYFIFQVEVLAITEHQSYLLTSKNIARPQKGMLPSLCEVVPGKLINR